MRDWGNKRSRAEEESKVEEEEAKKPEVVSIGKVDNHIYFYNGIYREAVLELNKELRTKSSLLLANSHIQDLSEPIPIYLHINSYGGSVLDGFAAMDEILKCKVPVNTIIDGACASAATLLSVVGHKRCINKHALFLIHQLSHEMWGKYSELKEEMENLDMVMKMMKDVYKKHTKIPMKELNKILNHNLWFDAEKCLEYGLVDEIL